MKNHEEMFQALLAGETLISQTMEYKLIDGEFYGKSNFSDKGWLKSGIPGCGYVEIKPKTININGLEVPEPLRAAPNRDETYWYVCFSYDSGEIDESFVDYLEWDNDSNDNRLLKAGLIHETKAAALLHAQALLSFTKLKED